MSKSNGGSYIYVKDTMTPVAGVPATMSANAAAGMSATMSASTANAVGLFIFRRDLRIEDNIGLNNLCKLCKIVYCVFILDDKQISPTKNKYFTYAGMRFMIQSLIELKSSIPLLVVHGNTLDIIETLIDKLSINILAFNRDYTAYSIKRDMAINDLAKKKKIACYNYDDSYINAPETTKPYKVYTPYYNFVSKIPVVKPSKLESTSVKKIHKAAIKSVKLDKLLDWCNKNLIKNDYELPLVQSGGRKEGLKLLNDFAKNKCKKYSDLRNYLTFETSRLSPHLKFGTISIREVYYGCGSSTFRKELYWRDFYMQISFYFPHIFGNNFREINIAWQNNKLLFKKWCLGETGYDIVDACMMQLNKIGYMHNRGRMIVANFLTKILHIDWRWGEKYFANKLVDYDPCSNNGGWQWSSGTGADAQPYYRIFNPELQGEKFDGDMTYRKRWLADRYVNGVYTINPIVDYTYERESAAKYLKK